MTQTVPTTTSGRELIAANLLNPGDHILMSEEPVPCEDINEVLRKVLSVHPYEDGDSRVLLVLEHEGIPAPRHFLAEQQFAMATSIEIDEASGHTARHSFADQLRQIAVKIDDTVLPMGRGVYSSPVVSVYCNSLAEVEFAAKALGVGVSVDSAGRHSAFFKPTADRVLVKVEWFVYVKDGKTDDLGADEPAADPLGLGHSRGPDDPTPVSPARVPAHVGSATSTVADEHEQGVCWFKVPTLAGGERNCGEPIKRVPALDGGWGHADGKWRGHNATPLVSEPVHHFAENGFTACGLAYSNVPKGEGFGQAADATTCLKCLTERDGCE